MRGLYVHNVLKIAGGALFGDRSFLNKEIEQADTDSRKLSENGLFFAIKGKKVDSHRFIEQMMNEKKIVCAVGEDCAENVFSDVSNINGIYIRVSDVYLALRQVACFYRSLIGTKIVGVTGSVGKTGTKEMIAAVLASKYNVHKTSGNYNNEIGVPLTVFGIEPWHNIAVVEMGISDFLEMGRLAQIVKPDIMVITNIGNCHLEKLIDRNGVLRAKTEVFDYMSPDGKIILNADDDKLLTISDIGVIDKNNEIVFIKPCFYGISNKSDADIYSENIVINDDGTVSFEMIYAKVSHKVNLNFIGEHNVYNAMAAALVGLICDIDIETIISGFSNVSVLSGRANMLTLENNIRLIDDCYNASPMSMKSALKSLSSMNGESSHKLAVIGDMLELGDMSNIIHKEIGEFIVDHTDIKRVIFIGKQMKNAFEAAKISDTCCEYFENTADFIKMSEAHIKENDIVLIKASHSMGFDMIKERIISKYKVIG